MPRGFWKFEFIKIYRCQRFRCNFRGFRVFQGFSGIPGVFRYSRGFQGFCAGMVLTKTVANGSAAISGVFGYSRGFRVFRGFPGVLRRNGKGGALVPSHTVASGSAAMLQQGFSILGRRNPEKKSLLFFYLGGIHYICVLNKNVMTSTIFLSFIATSVLSFAIGHLFGQHSERKDWNQLIKDGTLPKPKNHNK